MTDQDKIKQLKAWLKRVADHNNDEWRVTVDLNEWGYKIEVMETADRHILTEGTGHSLDNAIVHLAEELPLALNSWGYTMPEGLTTLVYVTGLAL